MRFDANSLTRIQKRRLLMALDAVVIASSLWLSLVLRLGDLWPEERLLGGWWLFVILPPLGIKIFEWRGVYRNLLRSMGLDGYLGIASGVIILSMVMVGLMLLDGRSAIPASTPAIFGFIGFVWASLVRALAQSFYYWLKFRCVTKKAVVIYGAGDTGTRLADALSRGSEYQPVAFIDDDPTLYESSIHGRPVLRLSDLESVISRGSVSKVFLALPSATIKRRKEILCSLKAHDVEVQTVPSMSELIGGFARVDQLRNSDANDLLQRESVAPITELATLSIKEKSVAVTGGGGSIGSELCRQILAIGPKCLVVYEQSELALYKITQELREIANSTGQDVPIHAVLGSVCDKRELSDATQRYEVQTLYHAAAYKHVPIVEENVIGGIINNVVGSMVVAEAAAECGIERVILVSTDKAVRPTSVMGASKRLAELVFQDQQIRHPRTTFSMVRFGNVINSSGSVIPLFQKQIKNYGPVTVTHPEMTRYFMTIPEAAQLVIQAGSMATGGDVFVLDMGQPVRIADLARRMVELSGLEVRDEGNPRGDIEIVYTGLRPGEKLHEELLIDATSSYCLHPKIMRAEEKGLSPAVLAEVLDGLKHAVESNDEVATIRLLKRAVPEYKPVSRLSELLVSSPAVKENRPKPSHVPRTVRHGARQSIRGKLAPASSPMPLTSGRRTGGEA